MLDVMQCREHARRYLLMAEQTRDHRLKQHLAEIVQGWLRVAAELGNLDYLMAELRVEWDNGA